MKRLYTYGYTGGNLDDLRAYTAAGATIADIRFSPNSRNPTWRKEHLEAVLGDEYQWIHALGNRNYRSGGCIQIVDLADGLEHLAALLEEGPVVLLCGCADALTCHRSSVSRAARSRLGVEVRHLAAGDRL